VRQQIRYFQFCPGIPWQVNFGKILPKISQEVWDDHIKNKEIVILAHNGLLEAFWSLSILRAINSVEPLLKASWAGNEAFKDLISACSGSNYVSFPDVGAKYPTPIFMDKAKTIYFNCLNNYITTKTYKLKNNKPNNKPLLQQIFINSLLPWNKKYIPKLNNFDYTNYKKWCKSINFFDNKKFILIIDKTIYSQHNIDYLNWDNKNILNLAGLMNRFGIEILYCSDKKIYNNQLIHMIPENDLSILIPLIEKCWIILSRDIDYLLIAMMISQANIISNKLNAKNQKSYDIYNNAEFLEAENMIYSYKGNLDPHEVYSLVEGLI